MFKKRGQVSVFLIVGVIVLLLVASLIFISKNYVAEETSLEKEKTFQGIQIGSNIQYYVEKCIQQTGEEALVYIGKHGGYYQLPKVFDSEFMLPYYFYEKKNKVISREELERQLSLYLEDNLFFCLRNFKSFQQQGYRIEQGKMKTKTKLSKKSVSFKVTLPLYFVKGTLGKELTLFEAKVSARLQAVHKTIDLFMQEQEKKNDSICLSCLTKLAIDNDLRVEMSPDNNTMLFVVIDEKVKVKKKDYYYEFVNQYDWGNRSESKEFLIENITNE